MNRKQQGFINFGTMTLLVGGLALIGLLFYSAQSGHELPLWPAVVVILVNVVAAGKILLNAKKAKSLAAKSAEQPTKR
ncbi:MAG: hypothetical protein CVU33_13110 [Betaproteobacteria bacterium HGW-Betaproteobacteria-6]|nr:MAG: hypothetical protein CVU33_13110 [Betaproteobacteria bacterium HGW-Betaproteobacteria-6]